MDRRTVNHCIQRFREGKVYPSYAVERVRVSQSICGEVGKRTSCIPLNAALA
jgi:hypothetical protein